MLNDVLSTPQARLGCFDISNFYLGMPLDRPEYVRIKIADIPHEFIDEYNLTNYSNDGWVYFEINKGVYGLKQAGKLANDLLLCSYFFPVVYVRNMKTGRSPWWPYPPPSLHGL